MVEQNEASLKNYFDLDEVEVLNTRGKTHVTSESAVYSKAKKRKVSNVSVDKKRWYDKLS